MADWTDPTTWRDIKKFDLVLRDLSRRIAADAPETGRDVMQEIVSVMAGHQKSVTDMSAVVGKLVAYTTAAHEERRLEIDAIHDLVKSVKKLNKSIHKLTRRVEKIELKSARAAKKR